MRGSPAPNRVTPLGEIEAIALRGAYTGNRGILHEGHEIVRPYQHDSWVTCALRYRDWWHEQWTPHRLTWLYFYDEAVAMAAGHRPCALCRRRAYTDYQAAWADNTHAGLPSAKEMNRRLHRERVVPRVRQRRLHSEAARELPDGAFVMLDDGPHLILGDAAVLWTRQGYGALRRRPAGEVLAITPPLTLGVLRAGYDLDIHPSASDRSVDPALDRSRVR